VASVLRWGAWGTLWRLAVILLLELTMATVAVAVIGTVFDREQYDALFSIMIVLGIAAVLEVLLLYITHRINKRTYRKNKD
jgi:undecaprenyl pyrophosphate phosphatase UppP